ncbi:MAG: hypothetical protein FWE06_06445 [Oscillospiraceae bacterium]|nr:hypothetical protein [Oscillospiraceae bacterium]
MSYCPHCKVEYREDFSSCADCSAALTSEPPASPKHTPKKVQAAYAAPTFLCSATHGTTSDILLAALRGKGIPAQARHRGAGEFLTIYMGASAQGMDIFVPSDMLEQARNIAANFSDIVLDDTDNENFAADLQQTARGKRLKSWILLALFVGLPGLLVLVLHLLWQ